MKTRKTKWLSILLAVVMCVSCIQPVHAADESNSDQTGTNATYYYNNNFDTVQDLSSSFTGAMYSQEFNASQTAGHIKFQVGEGATEAQFTTALTDAEVKNILVEVELSATETGLPSGALKLAGKNTADEAVAGNLIYFGGNRVYTTADRASGTEIATVSTSGFVKLGMMLNVADGTLTSADVYQFDAVYESWEFLGTTAIGQSFANFTDVQLYAEEAGKAVLFDDLKVYSNEVSAT